MKFPSWKWAERGNFYNKTRTRHTSKANGIISWMENNGDIDRRFAGIGSNLHTHTHNAHTCARGRVSGSECECSVSVSVEWAWVGARTRAITLYTYTFREFKWLWNNKLSDFTIEHISGGVSVTREIIRMIIN